MGMPIDFYQDVQRSALNLQEIGKNLGYGLNWFPHRFWRGTVARGNGESLVQDQRCPAAVIGFSIGESISQNARRY
jgi:hypothetical protein